nr:hypothetical protein 3 [Turkana negevirus]
MIKTFCSILKLEIRMNNSIRRRFSNTYNNMIGMNRVLPRRNQSTPRPTPPRVTALVPYQPILRSQPISAPSVKNKSKKNRTKTIVDSVESYFNYVKTALFDSSYVLCFIFAAILLIGYTNDSSNNFITKFVKKLETTETTKTIGEWLLKNMTKFIGFIAFVPGILSVKESKRVVMVVSSLLWVWVIPDHTPYDYLIQGTLVFLALKTNINRYRIFTLLVMVLCYVVQIGFSEPKESGGKTSDSRSSQPAAQEE